MYLYQTRYGSLYLHVGAISSLYMAGLAAGAALYPAQSKPRMSVLSHLSYLPWLVLHAVLLVVIGAAGVYDWTHPWFAGAFVLCGILSGRYFPVAAGLLHNINVEPGRAAAALQTADHIGAATGALLTGLLIVPVLGTSASMWLFAALLAANVPAALLRAYRRGSVCISDEPAGWLRTLGYTLFGVAATVVLASNLLSAASSRLRPALPDYAAQALAGAMRIEKNAAGTAGYFAVYDANERRVGYILSSQDFAPQVRGFGGKMNVAIYIDAEGKLVDFSVIGSNETPSYLAMLTAWFDKVRGHQLLQPAPFTDVAAVTGATISSNAILSAVQDSTKRFASEILGRPVGTLPASSAKTAFAADISVLCLAVLVVATFLVVLRGGFRTRLAVLAANLLTAGFIFNTQYSAEQIASLLSGQIPAVRLSAAFMLTLGTPLLALLFGNIYCGYLCPFGALQELLGYILPSRYKSTITPRQMQYARFVKYVVLFVLIVAFFLTRNRSALAADPLTSVFNLRLAALDLASPGIVIAIVSLAGSFLYPRFWCRYLCPAGAFLSLFNNFAVLSRLLPAKIFARCEFGVTAKDRLDCLYCDKCRHESASPPVAVSPRPSRTFLIVVAAVALIVSAVSITTLSRSIPRSGADIAVGTSAGQSRDVDVRRIEKMLKDKQLSDREADFYTKLE